MDSGCKLGQYPKHDFCRLPLTSGRNQSNTEVIHMNRPRNLGSRRILAYMAMLLGAMLTTMALPAYGQQDVDPTWYDPYAVNTPSNPAAAQTVAMHSSPTPVAMQQHQRPLSS